MDLEKITRTIVSPSEATIDALLGDKETVFWVGWRQADETIADECESVLQTGRLCGELVEVDSDEGYEVYLQFGDRRVKVPLTYTDDDRHITLCALNNLLAPAYEVRFCIDSQGSDSGAFVPLPCSQWAALEREYGKALNKRFYKFSERPNLFTDRLSF